MSGAGGGGARMKPSWGKGVAEAGGSNRGGDDDPVNQNVDDCSRQ